MLFRSVTSESGASDGSEKGRTVRKKAAPGPNDPGGGPHQQYYPGPQQPHQPRKKRSGCGCGCAAFAVIVLVVLALTYLQVWGVYDWVYEIFGVGSPRQFVWD